MPTTIIDEMSCAMRRFWDPSLVWLISWQSDFQVSRRSPLLFTFTSLTSHAQVYFLFQCLKFKKIKNKKQQSLSWKNKRSHENEKFEIYVDVAGVSAASTQRRENVARECVLQRQLEETNATGRYREAPKSDLKLLLTVSDVYHRIAAHKWHDSFIVRHQVKIMRSAIASFENGT